MGFEYVDHPGDIGIRAWGKTPDEAFREAMKGVELIAENRHAVKEEAPQAYKDIDEVIRVVVGAGLARPVARMRPMGVLKG